MKTRLDLLDSLPKGGVCAELGVFEGKFSEQIYKRTRPSIFYMVDTFSGVVISGDENGENVKQVDMEKQFDVLWKRCCPVPAFTNIGIEKSDSVKWLSEQQENSLDFCYIDTLHTYEQTSKELQAAFHAVKNGGFICGHDYNEEQFPGVVLAVDEFCSRFHELKCEIFDGDALASYKIEVRK